MIDARGMDAGWWDERERAREREEQQRKKRGSAQRAEAFLYHGTIVGSYCKVVGFFLNTVLYVHRESYSSICFWFAQSNCIIDSDHSILAQIRHQGK